MIKHSSYVGQLLSLHEKKKAKKKAFVTAEDRPIEKEEQRPSSEKAISTSMGIVMSLPQTKAH